MVLKLKLKFKWPYVISNKALYARCKTIQPSERIAESRWKLLGHICRCDENTPACNALYFAVESAQKYKVRRGRPRITLLSTIKQDLQRRNLELNNASDIYHLRNIARERVLWKRLF